ncbi:MAG TPA: nucleotidyltransferase domain-containing protein [Candidatus Nanoarchaeia archaeon]|nr:nucleotidyltransferase domain-containing protein [Candidatus Nanoarchaeia archaeon]
MNKLEKKIVKSILSEKYARNIQAIVLFGSRGRGDYNKDSDYDINVFAIKKKVKNKFCHIGMNINQEVNTDIIDKEEWSYLKTKAHPFLYCCFRDGKVLWIIRLIVLSVSPN